MVGSGEPVKDGDFVAVNYVASLYADGKKGPEFDRSQDKPMVFQVGRGGVIAGLGQGHAGHARGRQAHAGHRPGTRLWHDARSPRCRPAARSFTTIELVSVPRTQIRDLTVGTGDEAGAGDYVKVDYTGWIYENGARTRQFDSSSEHGEPVVFSIGSGMVIRGWEQGVTGMRVGGRRELIIPPEMGYGDRGTPNVPAGSTLLFEVTLLEVPRVQVRTLKDGTGEPAKIGDVLEVHYTGWMQDAAGQRGEQFDSLPGSRATLPGQAGHGQGHPRLGTRPARHEGRRAPGTDHPAGPRLRQPRRRRGIKQMIPGGSDADLRDRSGDPQPRQRAEPSAKE